MGRKILIVDDEPSIIELIRMNLPTSEFEVHSAWDGMTALQVASQVSPHLILLDIMLPDIDGFEVLRSLRDSAATSAIPILMLTAKSEEADKVIGLGLGAEDYITKPFGLRELEARIRNALRRSDLARDRKYSSDEGLKVRDLLLDSNRRIVVRHDVVSDLTTNEFSILHQLALNVGNTVSRQELLACISRQQGKTDERVIDVHIRNIRKKLGDRNEKPHYIETVRGAGYRMKPGVG